MLVPEYRERRKRLQDRVPVGHRLVLLCAAGAVQGTRPRLCTVTAIASAVSLALILTACNADRSDDDAAATLAGTIARGIASEGADLRVAYGKRWVIGGDVAADASGAFRVPATTRAVVAYIDANRNERFDRYAEPSGDCELVGQQWTCSLVLQRTTVQRAISHRASERGDQTLVFWEDFYADGSRNDASRLCVGNDCTVAEPGPFVAHAPGDVRMVSLCGEEGFADQQAVIRGAAHPAVTISHPPRLDVSLRSKREADALRVEVEAPSFDRLLVWASTIAADGAASHVHWHSESADLEVQELPAGVDARIPGALVRACERDPACEIVIQVLDYYGPRGANVVSATEFRSTVSFRGQP